MAERKDDDKGAKRPAGAKTSTSHHSATAPIATIAPPATTARQGDPALPNLALPKGGGAVRSIGEKFDVRAFTGTAGFTIPIATSPGRNGFGPELTLSYDSGNGNGPFGLGWSLGLPAIRRKTALGLPRYGPCDSTDVFILTGADDLVPALVEVNGADGADASEVDRLTSKGWTIQRYRPRTEGAFSRVERWTAADGDEHWRVIDRSNRVSLFGVDASARIADPADPTRIFEWLLQETRDERGQVIRYDYRAEDGAGVVPTMAGEANRLRPRADRRTRRGRRRSCEVSRHPSALNHAPRHKRRIEIRRWHRVRPPARAPSAYSHSRRSWHLARRAGWSQT